MVEIREKLDGIGAETDAALERFMNDEEMYVKYVRNFPDEPTMGRLIEAVKVKDYPQAIKEVHALKGIVNNLGFNPLVDATVDMLEELRAGNESLALEAYEDVKAQYKIFCDTILAWRNEAK